MRFESFSLFLDNCFPVFAMCLSRRAHLVQVTHPVTLRQVVGVRGSKFSWISCGLYDCHYDCTYNWLFFYKGLATFARGFQECLGVPDDSQIMILEDSLGIPRIPWGPMRIPMNSCRVLGILWSQDHGDSRDSVGFSLNPLGFLADTPGFFKKYARCVITSREVSSLSFPYMNKVWPYAFHSFFEHRRVSRLQSFLYLKSLPCFPLS